MVVLTWCLGEVSFVEIRGSSGVFSRRKTTVVAGWFWKVLEGDFLCRHRLCVTSPDLWEYREKICQTDVIGTQLGFFFNYRKAKFS